MVKTGVSNSSTPSLFLVVAKFQIHDWVLADLEAAVAAIPAWIKAVGSQALRVDIGR